MNSVHAFRSLLLITVLSAAQPALAADSKSEARRHFDRGVELYKEGDFAAALAEFRRANELAPSFNLQFNIGRSAYELRDYPAAQLAFERFLADGGKKAGVERRKEAEAALEKLRSRVAQLTVISNVPGATLSIDGTLQGTLPLDAPLRIAAGRHELQLTAPHHAPVGRSIEVVGGDDARVELTFSEPAATEPPRVAEPTPPPKRTEARRQRRTVVSYPAARGSGPSTGFWVGVGVTTGLALGAGVLGALAVVAKSHHDEELARFPGDPQRIDDSKHTLLVYSYVADGLTGAALLAGGLTLVLAWPGSNGATRSAVHVTPSGVSWRSTF